MTRLRWLRSRHARWATHARAACLTTLLALSLVSPACATQRRLVAEDGTHRMRAADTASGITVILTTEAWDGDPELAQGATIVHVLIANQGSKPVLLAPGDFELVDIRGFRYDLFDAGGSFTAMGPGEQWRPRSGGYDPGRRLDFKSIHGIGADVSAAALPWGTLLPGTQMRGFLYFEDLRDAGGYEAQLTWRAQTPEHEDIAEFVFDLHIAKLKRARRTM